jgi:Flp pilus assembly protein TadD
MKASFRDRMRYTSRTCFFAGFAMAWLGAAGMTQLYAQQDATGATAQTGPARPQGLPSSPSATIPDGAEQPGDTLDPERKAIAERRFEDARVQLDSFDLRHPGSAEGLYLLGELLMRENHAEQSLTVFTRAAAIHAPSGEELRLVGLDYFLLKDYRDATRWTERAGELAPGNGEIWYSLGRIQYSTGDFHAAELAFQKTLLLDPQSVKAENNLGLAYAAQNEPQKALQAYQDAMRMEQAVAKKSEQPPLNYGRLLIELGRTQEAVAPLAESVSIDQKCAPCHEMYGRALLQTKRTDEAARELQAAVALEPDNPRYHFELGRIYKKAGQLDKAQTELQLSAKLYGSHSTSTDEQ